MNTNVKFSERVAVLDTLDPASVAASTVLTAWVPVANFHGIAALLTGGAIGSSATIDAKLRQATDSSGTGAKDLGSHAITQITASNKSAILEARADELDTTNGFGYVAVSVTVATASSILGVTVFGVNPRYAPASASNFADMSSVS